MADTQTASGPNILSASQLGPANINLATNRSIGSL